VLDGGEQVTSLTLDTSAFERIDPASLTRSTFKVHAKATNPIAVATGDLVFTEYNEARNVLMTLVYTITQTAPLKLRNRGSLTLPGFTQGKLVDPEVDAYSYHKSADGMNYRLFSPTQGGGWERSAGRGKRPLIVWLYGGGEGGLLSASYYDNEPQLRVNRGALGTRSMPAASTSPAAATAATSPWR